ncbi:hypothetical protein [Nocardia nepalensis]|uniref:hypothetical protein n=1 Tax=Nocardia nepalensis TaxID=3375448 RepID=UPI003B66CA7A
MKTSRHSVVEDALELNPATRRQRGLLVVSNQADYGGTNANNDWEQGSAMTVLHDSQVLRSDRTAHLARSVGDGGWVVSYLRGRTLTEDQAVAALLVAEELSAIRQCAQSLGLTALEIVGMAATECTWPPPKQRQSGGLRIGSRKRTSQ